MAGYYKEGDNGRRYEKGGNEKGGARGLCSWSGEAGVILRLCSHKAARRQLLWNPDLHRQL